MISEAIATTNSYMPNSDDNSGDDTADDFSINYATNNSSDSEHHSTSQIYDKKKYIKCSDKEKQASSSRKRRSTSPYGKTKRVRWNEEERHAILKHFGNILALPQLPSLQECQNAIQKYESLKKRQPQHIKAWIDNQRRLESRHKAYKISKRLK